MLVEKFNPRNTNSRDSCNAGELGLAPTDLNAIALTPEIVHQLATKLGEQVYTIVYYAQCNYIIQANLVAYYNMLYS